MASVDTPSVDKELSLLDVVDNEGGGPLVLKFLGNQAWGLTPVSPSVRDAFVAWVPLTIWQTIPTWELRSRRLALA